MRQLITDAMADGGVGNAEAILSVQRHIAALSLHNHVELSAHERACPAISP
jgi:hypothetical protein